MTKNFATPAPPDDSRKADDDLRVAQVILSGEIGVEWAACFRSQQAAEKALTGVLVHLGIDSPKSHSLDRLVALMPGDVAERFDLDALIQLTPWAVAGRYPEDIANPTSAEAAQVIEHAGAVVVAARSVLHEA
ncbi:MAG: HEPN domain-containing protein [Acidimicrobiia bacterium]